MKKLLTEERLCELAGLQEADTEELWKTKRDAAAAPHRKNTKFNAIARQISGSVTEQKRL